MMILIISKILTTLTFITLSMMLFLNTMGKLADNRPTAGSPVHVSRKVHPASYSRSKNPNVAHRKEKIHQMKI